MYMYYGLCSVTLSDPSVDPSGGPWKTPRHFITCEHMQQTCNRQTMRIPFFADDRCRSTRCGFSRGLRARHHEVSHLPARFKPLAATVQKTPAERGLGPKKTNYRMFVSFCVHFWTGSMSDRKVHQPGTPPLSYAAPTLAGSFKIDRAISRDSPFSESISSVNLPEDSEYLP